jgi:hypothetical protein
VKTQPNPVAAQTNPRSVALGSLLGLAILKFGNPVILENEIGVPGSFSEWVSRPWPVRIGFLLFAVLAGFFLLRPDTLHRIRHANLPAWIIWPFAGWAGWQLVSSLGTIDPNLTTLTLPHLLSVGAAFIIGILAAQSRWQPLLFGLAAGSVLCWLHAVNQHTVEFRVARDMLLTGDKAGWTNISPAELLSLRENHLVIQTNGVDIANPVILDKLRRARVHGTLVYPNALAGLVALTFPLLMVSAWMLSRSMRPSIRILLLSLLSFLALGSLYWSGSRSGWLIAVAIVAVSIARIPSLHRYRLLLAIGIGAAGLAFFAIRNAGYLGKGATSVAARFDYWKAAANITRSHPVFGSGPGTFMRTYARLKSPDAEMARLVHNDYLQQFSDSGMPGGLLYLTWIGGTLFWIWKRHHETNDPLVWAMLVGTTGWFTQGLSEFSLYVPALSWTAFTFLGILTASPRQIASTPPNPTPHPRPGS